MNERLADYKLPRERHVPIRVAIQVYRPLRLTVLEQQLLRRIRAVPGQNMYDVVLAYKNKVAPNNFEQQEALFYLQLLDEQGCLSVIVSLFLKKQIIFE